MQAVHAERDPRQAEPAAHVSLWVLAQVRRDNEAALDAEG